VQPRGACCNARVDEAMDWEGSTVANDPKLDLLRRVPLFTQCRAEPLDLIARLADEVDVPDGYTLMRQGDLGQEFFVIVDGRVRIERDGATVNRLGPGDYLGEISLLQESRRTATAITEGPTKLLVITHQGFNSLLDSSSSIRAAIIQGLASRLRLLEPDAPG
jgi:CRP/FNR family cyclic AMP-dependent transcriptional regulator